MDCVNNTYTTLHEINRSEIDGKQNITIVTAVFRIFHRIESITWTSFQATGTAIQRFGNGVCEHPQRWSASIFFYRRGKIKGCQYENPKHTYNEPSISSSTMPARRQFAHGMGSWAYFSKSIVILKKILVIIRDNA